MSATIFVDTGAWLALTDDEDSYHAAALSTHTQLERQRSIWVTTNLVLAESYVLILRRGGYPAAMGTDSDII